MAGQAEDHEVIDLAAAQWAVRSLADDVTSDDLAALTLWLEESPLHVRAYEQAMSLWDQLDGLPAQSRIIQFAPARRGDPMRNPVRRWLTGGAIAAGLAAAVAVPVVLMRPAPVTTYETKTGEQRSFTLADGSVLSLNTATRVSVQLGNRARHLVLEQGEVALKVTHDAARPLDVIAGDSRITDIGTEFAVLRDDGAVRVAVREGEVEIAPLKSGMVMHLKAGDVAARRDGAAIVRTAATPDEAFAWQTRHAIYQNQPLSVVARDLNRYFDKPLIVDETSGRIIVTAVLTLDSETAVVGRLQEFLPLEARATDKAVYLTRAGDGRRRAEP